MRKYNFNLYTVCLLFFIVLFNVPVNAQHNDISLEVRDQSSSKIYVLSNRESVFQNNTEITLNKVKATTGLNFLRANSPSKDSLQIEKIDSTDFLTEISLLKGNWVVFVHGDAKTLEQSIYRGLKIQNLYNVNVLVFTWPSKDPKINGVKNFKRSQSHVVESLNHFIEVLNFVHLFKNATPSFKETKKMSLFFHSLGNLYIKKMIKNNLEVGLSDKLFNNIILNAAAVDQKNHKEWVEKLKIQERIFIISNKNDFNLKGAHIFTSSGKQLGEKLTPPFAKNATYMNFNKTVGFRSPTADSHTYFIGKVPKENLNLKEFYDSLLQGENPDFNNENIYNKYKDTNSYEIIQKK